MAREFETAARPNPSPGNAAQAGALMPPRDAPAVPFSEPAPFRPLLRYLGGKWRIAPWILTHLPPHDIYVEPFGGSAAVLLQKEPARSEIYNDLDDELVNLFRVLRSPGSVELLRLLALTPYARAEYLAAFEPSEDPVERARRTICRSHMAHGNMSLRRLRPGGLRVDGTTGQTSVGRNWAGLPEAVAATVERLRAVIVERRPALDLIDQYDVPNALLFLDPPYLAETRSCSHRLADSAPIYRHEMSVRDHAELLDRCLSSRAMIVLCGYPSPLYDDRLRGWSRREGSARANRNTPRTEVLWINPAAANSAKGPLL